MDKNDTVFLLSGILLFIGAGSYSISLYGPDSVYGLSNDIILKDPASFYDNSGKLNIVGVIDNNGEFPVGATVGVNVTRTTDSESTALADGNSFVSTATSP